MKSIFQQILRRQCLRNSYLPSAKNLRQFCDHKPSDKIDNTSSNQQPKYTKDNLHKLIASNKVVVFMKGNPEAPRCGFSNAVVQILRMHGVSYDAHDVLLSDELRQNIKDFTEWPTIPQVFLNGEFIGGCDILLQMHQNGELIEELKKVGIQSVLLKEEKGPSSTQPTSASGNIDNKKKE